MAEIPNPNSTGDWTIVSRRRRRRRLNSEQPKSSPVPRPQSPAAPPSPWTPIEPLVDPERQAKILRSVESAIQKLDRSPFYRRFLLRLRAPSVQRGLAGALSSAAEMRMVVYGVGSVESHESSRLQLALAVLLRRDIGLPVPSLEVFDPVLSATECAVVAALGGMVVPVDERGRREVSAPTLFYMPHCEVVLYDGLLEANWRPSCLNRMVVLGNSFSVYEQYVEMGRWTLEVDLSHLLWVRRYATELELEEKEEGVSGMERKQDDEDGIFKAFHHTSWHFFQLEDDTKMDLPER
ncbi:hypothetical protein Cni_G15632 [Canna indica]|uniref:SRR1-like domain-containing protein n=1 Tax=Canna indica TaxID=4628 RepID=A0AAQ3QF32_9LILI|nr:hypothetical protein Cni_G15632 [Canna indica]